MSHKVYYKKMSVLGIKYAPSIMALSCCLKLVFLDLSDHTHTIPLLIVNLINTLLNAAITYWAYCLGKTFNLCWMHRLLCVSAYVGYFLFLILVMFNVAKNEALPVIVVYAFFIILMNIFFYIITKKLS